MAEELQKVHLYYDDINKIRVIETNILKETEDLKDTCKDYDTSTTYNRTNPKDLKPPLRVPITPWHIKTNDSFINFDMFIWPMANIFNKVEDQPDEFLYLWGGNMAYEYKIHDFGKIINALLEVLKELGDNVEKKKMAAIGSMNLLKSTSKEREAEQAKLQAEINDKSMILEQLDSEYDALQILEATQMETIEYLTQIR